MTFFSLKIIDLFQLLIQIRGINLLKFYLPMVNLYVTNIHYSNSCIGVFYATIAKLSDFNIHWNSSFLIIIMNCIQYTLNIYLLYFQLNKI